MMGYCTLGSEHVSVRRKSKSVIYWLIITGKGSEGTKWHQDRGLANYKMCEHPLYVLISFRPLGRKGGVDYINVFV